jgi:hypothetical protein
MTTQITQSNPTEHEAITRAKTLAAKNGSNWHEELSKIMHAEPATYESYIEALTGHKRAKMQPVAADSKTAASAKPYHEFVMRADAYGRANNIPDDMQAQVAFAKTAQGSELYAAYNQSLR